MLRRNPDCSKVATWVLPMGAGSAGLPTAQHPRCHRVHGRMFSIGTILPSSLLPAAQTRGKPWAQLNTQNGTKSHGVHSARWEHAQQGKCMGKLQACGEASAAVQGAEGHWTRGTWQGSCCSTRAPCEPWSGCSKPPRATPGARLQPACHACFAPAQALGLVCVEHLRPPEAPCLVMDDPSLAWCTVPCRLVEPRGTVVQCPASAALCTCRYAAASFIGSIASLGLPQIEALSGSRLIKPLVWLLRKGDQQARFAAVRALMFLADDPACRHVMGGVSSAGGLMKGYTQPRGACCVHQVHCVLMPLAEQLPCWANLAMNIFPCRPCLHALPAH